MRRLPLRSPPRMRGKGIERSLKEFGYGITPACAGKRAAGQAMLYLLWDHPRVCGEKQKAVVQMGVCLGITPAYAGKSQVSLLPKSLYRDHPRVCGEKVYFWAFLCA